MKDERQLLNMSLNKNDIVKVEITGMTSEGAGVGRYDGFPIFIPLAAISDVLEVRIVKALKKFAYGKIGKILQASSDRIDVDCPYFRSCGGCVYRHINYAAELAAKEKKVSDALTRIGGLTDFNIEPIAVAENRGLHGYRNKALIPLGRDKAGNLEIGFYSVNSHRIIDMKACLLQPPIFNEVMKIFRKWCEQFKLSIYDETSHSGLLRKLYLRIAEKTGQLMVCLVAVRREIPHTEWLITALQAAFPSLTSVIVNVNPDKTNVALGKKSYTLWGSDYISDKLCGLDFDISPLSFYQVNPRQTEKLYAKAAAYAGLTGNEILLDLYCGTGTIGLSMASNAKKIIGVEIVKEAVENAKKNAERNNIQNAEFICADAAEAALALQQRGEKPDVIIIDPPRKGCDESLIQTIAELSPQRVVYVSCDPATLARDVRLFKEWDYLVEHVAPVDMFPFTAHVECVVLMSRVEK